MAVAKTRRSRKTAPVKKRSGKDKKSKIKTKNEKQKSRQPSHGDKSFKVRKLMRLAKARKTVKKRKRR